MPLRMTLLPLACALLLQGCQSSRDVPFPVAHLQFVPCSVPGDLLACAAKPDKPANINTPGATTDAQGADYIVRLDAAGSDCREKLAAVRAALATCKESH